MFGKSSKGQVLTTQPSADDSEIVDPNFDLATGGLQGLDYINSIDRLIVCQKMAPVDFSNHLKNEYIVLNSENQPVFVAREESVFLSRR